MFEFVYSYFGGGSECAEPQRYSCSIQRMTYEGMFSMATFRDLAPHRNTIASRSTKVTLERSKATLPVSMFSVDSAFCSSGTYSPVNCPHKCTLSDSGVSRTVVIFNTAVSLPGFVGHFACHHTSLTTRTLSGLHFGHLNWCLLIFSARILDSRVEAGSPRRTAAPSGPEIRPRVSRSTASISALC